MNGWLSPEAFETWIYEERCKDAVLVQTSHTAVEESRLALLRLQTYPTVAELIHQIRSTLAELRTLSQDLGRVAKRSLHRAVTTPGGHGTPGSG